jgi:hypothetical protein
MKTHNRKSENSFKEIEKTLAGYGQDIATRNMGKWEQPWASLEISITIFAIIVWLLKTSIKTIIEQTVKNKVSSSQSKFSNEEIKERICNLEKRIELLSTEKKVSLDISVNVEQKIEQYITELKEIHNPNIELTDNQLEELTDLLHKFGLSKRKSNKLAQELKIPLSNLINK